MLKRCNRTVIVIAAGILLVLLTSLAGVAKEPVKITFGWWGNVAIAEDYEVVFQRFHELNPDIIVEGIHWGWSSDAREKLTVTLAAGTAPDVFMIPSNSFAPALLQLDDYVARSPELIRQLVPDGVRSWRVDIDRYGVVRTGTGKQIGLPLYSFATAIAYNQNMFDEAGIKLPDPDWTYDDLAAIGRKLPKADNGDGRPEVYGLEWYYRSSTGIGPLVAAYGGSWPPFTDDPITITINRPENLVGLDVLRRWIHEDGFHPMPSIGLRNLAAKNVAMVQGHNDTFLGYPKAIGDQFVWDVLPMPVGPAGRFSQVFHQGIGINASTPHPEEAWRFILFFLGKEGAILQNQKAVRLNSNIVAAPEYIKRLPFNGEVILKSFEYGVPSRPSPPIQTNIHNELYSVWNGLESLSTATERIAKVVTAELAEIFSR